MATGVSRMAVNYKETDWPVGYGNIGKTLAKRLSGFDVELLAFDKQPDYQVADKAGVQFVSIEDIFMQSHVIIVLLPFSSGLENFISHKYLSMMRNGALIINVARESCWMRALYFR